MFGGAAMGKQPLGLLSKRVGKRSLVRYKGSAPLLDDDDVALYYHLPFPSSSLGRLKWLKLLHYAQEGREQSRREFVKYLIQTDTVNLRKKNVRFYFQTARVSAATGNGYSPMGFERNSANALRIWTGAFGVRGTYYHQLRIFTDFVTNLHHEDVHAGQPGNGYGKWELDRWENLNRWAATVTQGLFELMLLIREWEAYTRQMRNPWFSERLTAAQRKDIANSLQYIKTSFNEPLNFVAEHRHRRTLAFLGK
jgi:hypothetical protein